MRIPLFATLLVGLFGSGYCDNWSRLPSRPMGATKPDLIGRFDAIQDLVAFEKDGILVAGGVNGWKWATKESQAWLDVPKIPGKVYYKPVLDGSRLFFSTSKGPFYVELGKDTAARLMRKTGSEARRSIYAKGGLAISWLDGGYGSRSYSIARDTSRSGNGGLFWVPPMGCLEYDGDECIDEIEQVDLHIFRSTFVTKNVQSFDTGRTWIHLPGGMDGKLIDEGHAQGDTVVALSPIGQKLYRSPNLGRTWDSTIACDTALKSIWFACGILWGGFVEAGTRDTMGSLDLGASWTVPKHSCALQVAKDPVLSDTSLPVVISDTVIQGYVKKLRAGNNGMYALQLKRDFGVLFSYSPERIAVLPVADLNKVTSGSLLAWKSGKWICVRESVYDFENHGDTIVALVKSKNVSGGYAIEKIISEKIVGVNDLSSKRLPVIAGDGRGSFAYVDGNDLFVKPAGDVFWHATPAADMKYMDSTATEYLAFYDSTNLVYWKGDLGLIRIMVKSDTNWKSSLYSAGNTAEYGLKDFIPGRGTASTVKTGVFVADSTFLFGSGAAFGVRAGHAVISRYRDSILAINDSGVWLVHDEQAQRRDKAEFHNAVSIAWTPIGNLPGSGLGAGDSTMVVVDEHGYLWYRKGAYTGVRARQINPGEIVVRRNGIHMNLQVSSRVRVEAVDMAGRVTEIVPEATMSGERDIPLPSTLRGVQILRVTVDGRTATRKYLPELSAN